MSWAKLGEEGCSIVLGICFLPRLARSLAAMSAVCLNRHADFPYI